MFKGKITLGCDGQSANKLWILQVPYAGLNFRFFLVITEENRGH